MKPCDRVALPEGKAAVPGKRMMTKSLVTSRLMIELAISRASWVSSIRTMRISGRVTLNFGSRVKV